MVTKTIDEKTSRLKRLLHQAEKVEFSHCSIFSHQLAGHGTTDTRYAMLRYKTFVLKIVNDPSLPKNLREFSFYTHISCLPDTHPLCLFTSRYYNPVFVDQNYLASKYFLKLENLTYGMNHFCSIDIKIGTKAYGLDVSHEKKQRIISKYPLQEEIALRICGIKVFDFSRNNFVSKNSHWGKTVTGSNLTSSLFLFFQSAIPVILLIDAIDQFVVRLELLLSYFRKQKSFLFRSSSLLLFYEPFDSAPEMGSSPAARFRKIRTKVKMVDFMHVHEADKVDLGYIKGLERLILEFELIKAMLQK